MIQYLRSLLPSFNQQKEPTEAFLQKDRKTQADVVEICSRVESITKGVDECHRSIMATTRSNEPPDQAMPASKDEFSQMIEKLEKVIKYINIMANPSLLVQQQQLFEQMKALHLKQREALNQVEAQCEALQRQEEKLKSLLYLSFKNFSTLNKCEETLTPREERSK